MKDNLERRDFFKLLGMGAMLSACQRWDSFSLGSFGAPKNELIYSGYRVGEAYTKANAGFQIKGETQVKRFKLANEIHSIQYSKNLGLKIFTSKLEKISYYQYNDGELKPLEAHLGHYFYGHGAIDEKRNLAYFTMARETKTRDEAERIGEPGYVYVYSLPDFRFVERFTSFGFDPHDMKIISGDQLVVCNGGGNSTISFIDLETRRLLKSYDVRIEHISMRHIDQVDDENFAIATLSRDDNKPCPPYLLNLKQGLSPFLSNFMFEMTAMRLQLLSIVAFQGHIYASCPNTDTVMVWRVGDGKFLGGVQIPSASNLCVSQKLKGVIAGSGYADEPARLIQIKDDKVVFEKLMWAQQISGAHATIIEA